MTGEKKISYFKDGEQRKKRILWTMVIFFTAIIMIIWGYGLKLKIDNINQARQKQSGLFANTKKIWNGVFQTNINSITTSTIARSSSTLTNIIPSTTANTITATSAAVSTTTEIKNGIKKILKQ